MFFFFKGIVLKQHQIISNICHIQIQTYVPFGFARTSLHRAKEKPHWATWQKTLTDGMMLPCLVYILLLKGSRAAKIMGAIKNLSS